MKKFYIFLFTLFISICFYGQNIEENDELKLNQEYSLQKVQEIIGFKMYPNPVTNGKLYIITSSDNIKKIQIYDIVGKQIISRDLKGRELDLSKIRAGIYILKVFENGKTTTRKLVIK